MTRIIDAMAGHRWAIKKDVLEQLRRIALRENDSEKAMAQAQDILARRAAGPSSVSARMGSPLKGSVAGSVRDGVAVIPFIGPVFPRANMMTKHSGATDLNVFSNDLHAALNDPSVRAVIIDIDSPGGVASGVAEMAATVRAAAQVKRVVAYVSGWAASAAYWIAAAADEIVMHEAAEAGSIGVVVSLPVQEQPDQNGDVFHEIVSSHAGNKRPDPRTEEGRAEILREIDALETIFIADVARYRNVGIDTVISDFGAGGMFAGAEAVRRGMADRTGDFESLLKELSGGRGGVSQGRAINTHQTKEIKMPMTPSEIKKEHPDAAAALIEEGKAAGKAEGFEAARKQGYEAGLEEGKEAGCQAERQRLAAIEEIARPGFEKVISAAKADGKSTAADVAMAMARVEKARGGDHLATIQKEADAMPVIEPSAGNGPSPSPEEDPSLSAEDSAKAKWASMDDSAKAGYGNKFDIFLGAEKAAKTGFGRSYSKK